MPCMCYGSFDGNTSTFLLQFSFAILSALNNLLFSNSIMFFKKHVKLNSFHSKIEPQDSVL